MSKHSVSPNPSPSVTSEEILALRAKNQVLTDALKAIVESAEAQLQQKYDLVWFAKYRCKCAFTSHLSGFVICLLSDLSFELIQTVTQTMKPPNGLTVNTKGKLKNSEATMVTSTTVSTQESSLLPECSRKRLISYTSISIRQVTMW